MSVPPSPGWVAPSSALASSLDAWRRARFGLFLHWGIYSLGAGQWRGAWTASTGPWAGREFTEFLQLQARVPVTEYEAFARGFRPDRFDADAWAGAARAAGMRYLVFTTKHHEGFALFRSRASAFNLVDHCGWGCDPVAELAAACARHGLLLGLYYSLGRDWHDPDTPTDWPTKGGRSNTWDFPDEDGKDFERYFRRKALPQVRELLSRYGPISILWFDTPEGITTAQTTELMALVRELQPGCLVNDRVGRHGGGWGDFQTFEQRLPTCLPSRPWEACATLGHHWGYHPRDRDWKSPEQLVRLLTDVVARGGNLLLNVGPRGDGTWPEGAAEHLRRVGDWLAINGAAIYGAQPWRVLAEPGLDVPPGLARPGAGGTSAAAPAADAAVADTLSDEFARDLAPDLRFTRGADGAIYVIVRSWRSETVGVRALGLRQTAGRPVSAVALLGHAGPVAWGQGEATLTLQVPAERPGPIPVWVFRVEGDG